MTVQPHEHAPGAAVWYWDRDPNAWRPAVVEELGHKEGWAVYDVVPVDGKIPAYRWGYAWQIAPRGDGQPMPPAPDLSQVQP